MSIPEKAWPDGAVAHRLWSDSIACWLMDTGEQRPAPEFDLPPGTITIRPDFALIAERDKLRAEVAELQAWKAAEQRALIEVGVKMQFEGCLGLEGK